MGRKILQLLNGLITFAVSVCLIGAVAYAGYSLWDNQQVYDSAESVFAELKDIRATIQTPTLSAMERLLEESRLAREAEAAARAAAMPENIPEQTAEPAMDRTEESTQELTQELVAESTAMMAEVIMDAPSASALEGPSEQTEAETVEATSAPTAEVTMVPASAVEGTPVPTVEETAEPVTETTMGSVAAMEGTPVPTETAAAVPTEAATAETTSAPVTVEPTAEATVAPVTETTVGPVVAVEGTPVPTEAATAELTAEATAEPTEVPTEAATAEPTLEPTTEPTAEPTVEPTPEPTPDNSPLGQLKQINQDITAWITLPGTAIDYPILQGSSNYSYINTDVYGNFALAGSIFLDSRNDPEYMDVYSLVYGHNMSQHRMFSDINLYKDRTFFEENRLGLMLLPDGYHILESLCVIVTRASDSGLFNPENWKALDAEGILRMAQENAMYTCEDGLEALEMQLERMADGTGDAPRIVSLSTCSDEFTDARTILLTLLDP